MKAVCWMGPKDVRVENVPDPKIINSEDIVIKVTSTAICGSDLHLYAGSIPSMEKGDILGHEFMGEVVEMGKNVTQLKLGDKVVVPFTIACGRCAYCDKQQTSLCDNSNPNASLLEKINGYSSSGLFGFSHLYGGFSGGQAEYVRVPYANVGPMKVPKDIPDESVLFLTDIFPTGYMAAENCDITPGDTVAVWGAGPVGLFAMKSAFLMGAERVIAIDRFPERLKLAREFAGAETVNYTDVDDMTIMLREMTGGRGPDACIDAVGMEAHGTGAEALYDRVKTAVKLETDRPTALRQLIRACAKGGRVSLPGVYGGAIDSFPLGVAFAKALSFKMGQTHVHRYLKPLYQLIESGKVDPSAIITHRFNLEQAPQAYEIFREKQQECIKVVLKP